MKPDNLKSGYPNEKNTFGYPDSHIVFLSLGTNLGDKSRNLEEALALISEKIGTVTDRSSVMETPPWGFDSPHSFYNMVIKTETSLSPTEVLHISKEIERRLGRTEKTTQAYLDRIIDIDLVMYDNLIIRTEQLTLPHPLFHKRDFVLEPLCEIDPDLIHPVFNKTIRTLSEELKSK